MDKNTFDDWMSDLLGRRPPFAIPKRFLHEWADIQFNYWNYCYWVLALGFTDQRILDVLLFHWPLRLDLGDGEEKRKLRMLHLADYIHHEMLYTMHDPSLAGDVDIGHGIDQDGEKKTAHFMNVEKEENLQFYWWIPTGWLWISVETAISQKTNSKFTLEFVFHDTRMPAREDTGIPLSVVISREIRTIDEMQVLTYTQEDLICEPLLFFQYRFQLRRLFAQWMELAPEYWKDKAPLLEVLEI
jgi:hypothetical protein